MLRRVGVNRLGVLLVLGSVLAIATAGVAAPIDSEVGVAAASSTAAHAGDRALQRASVPSAAPTENNSTQHVDPDEIQKSGDLSAVQEWLANRMADRLGNSTVELSQGEYELARRIVGDDYSTRFDQFVDVAGRTETRADDNATPQFRRAQSTQREYVTAVQTYRETYDRYRTARENGNTSGARRLARDLERQARRVNRTARKLVGVYGNLSATTDQDLSQPRTRVVSVRTTIADQQREVRATTFVETRLTASARRQRISYVDPLVVSGQLAAANGTQLADRTVRIRVAGETVRTTTNETGGFTLRYRPTRLPIGTETLTVEYVPRETAIFLPTNATVPVSVTQVTPALAVERSPGTVGYADEITVSGSVSVDGPAIDRVPLEVWIGGERVGTTTARDGGFSLETPLPAGIAAGERSITVRLPYSDRALAGTSATTPVRIAETDSEVTVTGTAADGTVRVNGTLRTPDGTPIANQPVAVRLDGTTVATVRTDDDGQYATRVAVPGDLRPENGTVERPLSVRFDGAPNLASSRAETTLRITSAGGAGGTRSPENRGSIGQFDPTLPPGSLGPFGVAPLWAWGVGVVVLVVGLSGAGYRRFRGRSSGTSADDAEATTDASTDEDDSGVDWVPVDEQAATSGVAGDRSQLELATARLEADDYAAAVEIAYGAARRALEAEFEGQSARTHREFLAAVRDDMESDRRDALQSLTERYELAAFAPGGIDRDGASEALRVARTLVPEEETSDSSHG